MASMDLQTIIQDLNRRFAAPLPEFYKRRIIFWHDDDREFEECMQDFILQDAKKVILTGSNNFEIKKLLSVDDVTSNYLIYCPISYEKPEENWLIDIELYSESFRADMISIWMDEMGIAATQVIRNQVKNYRKYLNAIVRREKIIKQKVVPTTPGQFHRAVMSAIINDREADPGTIIRTVLCAGLDLSTNEIYQDFVLYQADQAFWTMVKQGTGYAAEEPSLGQLAAHIITTALTRTMRLEYLAGLDDFISSPHQAYCYDFVSEWLRNDKQNRFLEIAKYVEDELAMPKRFMKLQVDDLVDTEIYPCVHEVILLKLMKDIEQNTMDDESTIWVVEKRRTCIWYEDVKEFYEGTLQVAYMQVFYKEHITGFHYAKAVQVWKEYTSEYYKMDTYYRLFQKNYGESLKSYNSNLHDPFSHVMEKVEALYKNWFLGQLGENWSAVCAEELEKYGYILEVPQQRAFYKDAVGKTKVRDYVIISDAMRYEVAASLTAELRRETQGKVDLNSMQGVFPTITKFGMAALLPHEKLTVEVHSDVLRVMEDGQYTESNYRDKVLKKKNPNSVALRYGDLVAAKRAERNAMVKGMDVVYIYHDTIDEASHTADSMVFPACEEAIRELKNLIRIIVNDLGGTNVIITADHGFLYTYQPLKEDDKVDKTGFVNRVVEYGRRFAIMQKDSNPENLLPIHFLDGESEYEGFAPRENIRIKMNGGGMNFVHGGISLQEMCVPVIKYHYLRNQNMEYRRNQNKYDTKPVEIGLLSSTHKVGNKIFSLDFYQKEAVSDNREPATYQVYFTDHAGKQISDTPMIIADKTNENGQERIFRCNFNLKSVKLDNKEIYYLVIADENGLVMDREEFQIDIPFALDDFDFFS